MTGDRKSTGMGKVILFPRFEMFERIDPRTGRSTIERRPISPVGRKIERERTR